MLDGLLGRGFTSKCKSLIKMVKTRIDVIRRKRNATLKFLKKDMADLLASGLDINAFGRAEGFLDELTVSSCYDFVEQSCDFVLKHLSAMQKTRHCPEDCREPVSSLMFAAARFSDLPELRDLRETFYERYGDSLKLFVSQEFVEKFSAKAVTKEKKLQIMQDVASEFSIKWDSWACEQRMSKAYMSAQDQPKLHGSYSVSDVKCNSINCPYSVPKEHKHDVSSKERLEHIHDEYKENSVLKRHELNPRSGYEVPSNGYKAFNVKEETILKDVLFKGRQEAAAEKHEPWKDDTPSKRLGSSYQSKRMKSADGGSKLRGGTDNLTHGKPNIGSIYVGLWSKHDVKDPFLGSNYNSQHNDANSARDVQKEAHEVKPYYKNAIPPPYTKPNSKAKDSEYGASLGCSHIGSESSVATKDSSRDNKVNAGNRAEKMQQREFHPDHEWLNFVPARENDHCEDNRISNPIPKPRSMRRRHAKSHSSHDGAGNVGDPGVGKRRSRSKRRGDSRRSKQILFDDEERMIDKLLMHYSKKPSAHEPGKGRRKSRSHHAHHQGTEAEEPPVHISKDGINEISGMSLPPRSMSLPREQMAAAKAEEKVFIRAASFQPERSTSARHVHPKLPDYDDLALRFAALKGR